jgi:hypothetical protein
MEDEEEGAMQEAMQRTRPSDQEAADIEDISSAILKAMPTHINYHNYKKR